MSWSGASTAAASFLLCAGIHHGSIGTRTVVDGCGSFAAPLGNLEMGALVAFVGAPAALAINGTLVLAAAALLILLAPAYRRVLTREPLVGGGSSSYLTSAAIVELHHATKLDVPSGTARLTAERLGGDVPIHSVRLPGLNAHQEVILGAAGQVLTIRHDVTSREAYTPGVLLALEKLPTLPPGVTVGLDALL